MHKNFALIYDEFMSFVDYNSWKKFILSFAKKGKLKVADLGCGTGNMSILFAKDNHYVKAFDISDEMLKIASLKNKEKNIEFKKANIINDDIGSSYDLIMCNFDTINYLNNLEDLDNLFANVKKSLKDDGVFVFDIVEEEIFNEIFNNDIFVDETDNYLLLMKHKKISKYKHSIEIVTYIKENEKYVKNIEKLNKTIFSIEKVFELLNKNGLKVYDNARNEEFGKSRLFIICKK